MDCSTVSSATDAALAAFAARCMRSAAELAQATGQQVDYLPRRAALAALGGTPPDLERAPAGASAGASHYVDAHMLYQAYEAGRCQRYRRPDGRLGLMAALRVAGQPEPPGGLCLCIDDPTLEDEASLAAYEGLLEMMADWLGGQFAALVPEPEAPPAEEELLGDFERAALRRAALRGDEGEWRRLMNVAFMRMYQLGADDEQRLRQLALDLVRQLIAVVAEATDGEEGAWPERSYRLEILQSTDVFGLSAWLSEAAKALTERLFDPLAAGRNRVVRDVLRAIDREPSAPHSLASLAATQHLSAARLGQLLREQTGRSFSTCLNEIRLRHARRALRQSERSIAAIAREVGYDDPAYFSRVFRRYTGESPAAWRRSQLESGDGAS